MPLPSPAVTVITALPADGTLVVQQLTDDGDRVGAPHDLDQHDLDQLDPAGQRWLGWLLVTPDFHRMHHSAERRFTNSNYGMLLSCWDRWLGTASAPCLGEPARRLVLGLEYFRAPAEQRLGRMLAQPFGRQGFGRAAAPDDQKAIN